MRGLPERRRSARESRWKPGAEVAVSGAAWAEEEEESGRSEV